MLNFAHLHYFWAVAHESSLTRAAELLNVSQSAVSVQIHKLESALGQALFERRGRRLVLTESGRLALDHADAIFELGGRLERSLRRGDGPARRIVRVGAVATLSRNFQLTFLSPLLTRSDVSMTLRSGPLRSLLQQLESHQLDVLLSNVAPPRESGVPWLATLVDEQPVALVGKAERRGRRRSWRTRLATEPLVVPTLESGVRAGLDELLHRLGLHPVLAAEVDDMAMLRLLVRNGVGLGVVPSIVVRDELQAGTLTRITVLPGLRETFYAITLPRHFGNPLVAELIGAARSAAKPVRRGVPVQPDDTSRT